jgi:hypothetical protein
VFKPISDEGLDVGADIRLRADDGLDDEILDGVPDSLRVDPQVGPHVAPQRQKAPLVTLTHRLICVRGKLRILLVDTAIGRNCMRIFNYLCESVFLLKTRERERERERSIGREREREFKRHKNQLTYNL